MQPRIRKMMMMIGIGTPSAHSRIMGRIFSARQRGQCPTTLFARCSDEPRGTPAGFSNVTEPDMWRLLSPTRMLRSITAASACAAMSLWNEEGWPLERPGTGRTLPHIAARQRKQGCSHRLAFDSTWLQTERPRTWTDFLSHLAPCGKHAAPLAYSADRNFRAQHALSRA